MSQTNTLSKDRIKELRALAHNLKPVVMLGGKGLSESVLAEIDRALEDHELIKVKVAAGDRDSRKAVVEEICNSSRAALIQEIGRVLVLFREAKKPRVKTSNLLR